MDNALTHRFFQRGAVSLAQALLGRLLVNTSAEGVTVGRIVETEAYDQGDPASHSYRGPTLRNRTMFGPAGRAYVYRCYGVHWCMNVVAGALGVGAAVLLRALEPIEGHALMAKRRELSSRHNLLDLARGPGRLSQAMGITGLHDGGDLVNGPLCIVDPPDGYRRPLRVATRRIGISRGSERLWRFCVVDCPFVSGPRRVMDRGRRSASQ